MIYQFYEHSRLGNFVVEKIDMKTFVTLNGDDLRELKINAFGARKRLLLAINQLKAENRTFQSSEHVSEYIHLSDFKDIPSLFTHLEMGHHIGNGSILFLFFLVYYVYIIQCIHNYVYML